MHSSSPRELDLVRKIVERHGARQGAMLPVLHEVQECLGFIPPDVVPLIAEGLNVSRAEVHGVITFYHHFRQTPPGRHLIQVCRAEACQAVGAEQLAAHIGRRVGCEFRETSDDGNFSLEPVYCLGQCATGPAVMIDGVVHARVSTSHFDMLLAAGAGEE